jgi:3'-5' exoribonuclease
MSTKSIFISDLKHGAPVEDEPFLLQEVDNRTTRDGRPFLRLVLSDSSGQINGVFWDVPTAVSSWARSGLVALIEGRVARYRNAPQIIVADMIPVPNPDMTDFLRSSGRSREEMIAELGQLVDTLSEPWGNIARHILLDPAFLPRFADAPAARRMHHAYMGGLLAHTLSMVTIARHLAGLYPGVRRDLLIAGVLLHDMGKVYEYDTTTGISVSEDGHLVGHILRGIVAVEQAAAALGSVSETDLRELIHLIASHHGTQEWGAPVTPKTLEAILLHQIDLLDSRVQGFLDFVADNADEGDWSNKPSPMFGSYLRRPGKGTLSGE